MAPDFLCCGRPMDVNGGTYTCLTCGKSVRLAPPATKPTQEGQP